MTFFTPTQLQEVDIPDVDQPIIDFLEEVQRLALKYDVGISRRILRGRPPLDLENPATPEFGDTLLLAFFFPLETTK